ncbi:MAG: TIGR02266 family protein [Clostridia bacterium]|nr:TIGR02266 family protein [Deltaproteobacteria bacterium]
MTDDPSSKRTTQRLDVTLKVALQYPDRETFVERFSINVSKTGLFIRARDPAPVGSRVRFEYRLKDESRIFRGTGIVRWARAAANATEPESPPGMGIEFVDLDPQSEELVNLIVAQHGEGERAPRKAAAKSRVEVTGAARAPAFLPDLDAEEEELLSGLELGAAPAKVRDDGPSFTEAKTAAPAEPIVDPDAPHVCIDIAGASVLATLLMPNDDAPPDRFDERKLELTVNIRDGRLVLGQTGIAVRSLYAWADEKTTLRNLLAVESCGLTLARDASGRPIINIDGSSIALTDLAVAAAKYTIDAYREQLGVTPNFRVIVPATIAMPLRAELTALASDASSTAQMVDDVVAIADAAKRVEAIVIAVSEFETRIACVSGRRTTHLATADGLGDIDTLVCQATARALLKEHGIDADDDPSLRESLAKQVHLARKDGDGSAWHVSIAGASVTMTADAIGRAIEPAMRRIATTVDAMRVGNVVVLAGDERLWDVIADRLEGLLGPIETLDSGAWARVGS